MLEPPHIAAAQDQRMTALEQAMGRHQATIEAELTALRREAGVSLTAATTALGRFTQVHQQVLALSRRNSNVRSQALALGELRTLSLGCDAKLAELQLLLSQRGLKATR